MAQTVLEQANPNSQLILRVESLFGSDIMVRLTHTEVEAPLCGLDTVVKGPTLTCLLTLVYLTALSNTSRVTSSETVMERVGHERTCIGDNLRTCPISTLSKTSGVT